MDGRFPLAIGVTGHRDLRPEQQTALTAEVRTVLQDLKKRCKHTPILLLSGLADGADRLVATVALELGIDLVAVLPMPLLAYLEDFPDDRAREELTGLVARSRRLIELPIQPGLSLDQIQPGTDGRVQQYAALAAFLASESHVVLALWDGVKGGAAGGTSEVVRFIQEGVPDPLAPDRGLLDEPEVQPVVQIVAARARDAGPAAPVKAVWHYPESWGDLAAGAKRFAKQLDRLETFNRDTVRLRRKLATQQQRVAASLLPSTDDEPLPAEIVRACETFAVADSLAIHFQWWARRLHYLTIGLVFLAGASLALFYNAPRFWTVALPVPLLPMQLAALNGVALVSAVACYRLARRREVFVKYQDYRALAEAMRVTVFWLLAEVPAAVAQQYLQKQRSELDWIRDAVRAWHLARPDPAGASGAGDSDAKLSPQRRLALVSERWVDSQEGFYRTRSATYVAIQRRQQRVLRPLIWTATALSIAWVAILIVTNLPTYASWSGPNRMELSGIVLVTTWVSLMAVLLRDLTHTTAIAALVTQYQSMASLFGRAQQRLKVALAAGDRNEAREILSTLGKMALRENGDWLLMHRERQLKDPTAR